MPVHDDRLVPVTFLISELKNRRIFLNEALKSIEDASISKASRIKGSTLSEFMDKFIEGIIDPNSKFNPYISGQRLYLIQPRHCGRSLAKFYNSTYYDNVFYEYYRKLIAESYRVISIDKYNSILEEIYENIKEDMKHGQREDYESYSRAGDIKKNRKLPYISKRGRITKRLRSCAKGIN